jgi:hypothetical protein
LKKVFTLLILGAMIGMSDSKKPESEPAVTEMQRIAQSLMGTWADAHKGGDYVVTLIKQ